MTIDEDDIIDETTSLHKELAELQADYNEEVRKNAELKANLAKLVEENLKLQRKVELLDGIVRSFNLMIAGAKQVLDR
jgi:predicted nuclease with TOPRIM domain